MRQAFESVPPAPASARSNSHLSNLKPGGYLECAELDIVFYTNGGQFAPDCPSSKWSRLLSQGIANLGMDPYPCQKLEGWIRDAGFINIKYELLPVPLGPWPKDKDLVRCPSPEDDIADLRLRKKLARTI
jgi:hypothetical protein